MNKRANAVLSEASELIKKVASVQSNPDMKKQLLLLSRQLAALMLVDEAPRRKAEKK